MPETAFKGSRLAKARSEVAVAHRKNDPEAIQDARRNFAEAKIADYVTRVLGQAPELREEQRTRLAELLRPARDAITQARLIELGADDGAA
jgi:hypothetical protein